MNLGFKIAIKFVILCKDQKNEFLSIYKAYIEDLQSHNRKIFFKMLYLIVPFHRITSVPTAM